MQPDVIEDHFESPHRLLWWTEAQRAALDLGGFVAGLPLHALRARGDGHSVLVLPGFLADDSSTTALRTVLRAAGYHPHGWELGRNYGPTRRTDRRVRERLHELHERSGRPVSLIGWSLGGFFARWLAHEFPDEVRLVITLGTPMRITTEDEPGLTRVGHVYHALRPLHTEEFDRLPHEHYRRPLPVPATAIYSRTDGVVPWRACLEVEGPRSENVEVVASHCGLGFAHEAVSVILDRLHQPEDAWHAYGTLAA